MAGVKSGISRQLENQRYQLAALTNNKISIEASADVRFAVSHHIYDQIWDLWSLVGEQVEEVLVPTKESSMTEFEKDIHETIYPQDDKSEKEDECGRSSSSPSSENSSGGQREDSNN